MVRGAWVSLCVRAMCELVVVGALDEPRSLAELAARTSSDPASPARLLRVLDVGGGQGAMLAGLLTQEPSVLGMVADRPEVAPRLPSSCPRQGSADEPEGSRRTSSTRCRRVATSMSCPTRSTTGTTPMRYRSCAVRTAMRADARLLVVEHVLDAPGRTPSQQRDVHLVDLHMLVMFDARERTKQGVRRSPGRRRLRAVRPRALAEDVERHDDTVRQLTMRRSMRCQRPALAASSARRVSSMPSRTGRDVHPSSVSALEESPR
jgi:hypothetical protein